MKKMLHFEHFRYEFSCCCCCYSSVDAIRIPNYKAEKKQTTE